MWVIRRNKDHKFVARIGSYYSYTSMLQNARPFNNKDDAMRNCCDNESIISVDSVIYSQNS